MKFPVPNNSKQQSKKRLHADCPLCNFRRSSHAALLLKRKLKYLEFRLSKYLDLSRPSPLTHHIISSLFFGIYAANCKRVFMLVGALQSKRNTGAY